MLHFFEILLSSVWNRLRLQCVLGYSLPSQNYAELLFTAFMQLSTSAPEVRGTRYRSS